MFNDIGALEIVTLIILAVLIFGPDKLPKLIQDVSRTIRKIRQFSDSAKQDIRNELGPEFKDFEFEDLNPKKFIRKQLENDDLGLKEIRNGFDLKKEMAEVADAVHGRDSDSADDSGSRTAGSGTASANGSSSGRGDRVDMEKRPEPGKPAAGDPPPFDADAT
ncbi:MULTISPECIES: sec-independent translocase [Streptomyces]|uniref:Sec-independent protein translocase protein TatB n=2 Tax=Streptomyces TaxID=1883 RepID=A0A0W7X095_9ACTN|nr:sec-independent translocase [Streptomyces silvensis]KUF16241.1 preprotein translocase [Streptomyces silvensis]MVO83307.1 Sec-independent protein translocase TatB [Streptomyces typhae]